MYTWFSLQVCSSQGSSRIRDVFVTTTYSYQFASDDFIDIVVTPTGDGLADATAGEVRILLDIKRI